MMRITQGRGDWLPRQRIPGLRRYAFIGDSTVYGFGVTPEEALPVVTERQMNELSLGMPVEAVNFGIPGYNMLNAWQDFRRVPQVYDGVIVVPCNNDSEIFSRSFLLRYHGIRNEIWDEQHPCARAVADCLDDIQQFTQDHRLQLLVCSYELWEQKATSLLATLCAERGIPFISTYQHFKELRYPKTELTVSAIDTHPSALAHEAVARQITTTAKRLGWFADGVTEAEPAPGRILAAAQAMVVGDHYPQDAALNWAMRALEGQTRIARRLQIASAGSEYSLEAARVSALLSSAKRHWHFTHRIQALVQDIAAGGRGVAIGLWHAEEVRLKIDELQAVIAADLWRSFVETLDWPTLPDTEAPARWGEDMLDYLQRCQSGLAPLRDAIEGLRRLDAEASDFLPALRRSATPEIDTIEDLIDRGEWDCDALVTSVGRLAQAFERAAGAWPAPTQIHALRVIAGLMRQLETSALGFVKWLLPVITRLGDAESGSYTTVIVTPAAVEQEDATPVIITVRAEYVVPFRLPFNSSGYVELHKPGSVSTIRLPLFYAARLTISVFIPPVRKAGARFELGKVEVYNHLQQKRLLEPASFYRDAQDHFVSPVIHLL
jgi:hypothetical protein